MVINADVGEESGNDEQIMPLISWCNIACGGHAGNENEIEKTVTLAIRNNVQIGAHPGYPDKVNFGRVKVEMNYTDLVDSLTNQIQLVSQKTREQGAKIVHVKPHGALYNDAVKENITARAIIDAVKNIDKSLYIITQKNGVLDKLSQGVLKVKYEAFMDRAYEEDLSLVSRSKPGAVLSTPEGVFEHVNKMINRGVVRTISGVEKSIFFDTICVHGDHQNSVSILKYLHQKIKNAN